MNTATIHCGQCHNEDTIALGIAYAICCTKCGEVISLVPREEPAFPMHEPEPDEIKSWRTSSGLTQGASARLVGVDLRTWQRWEAGDRRMSKTAWALYRLQVNALEH